MRKKLVIICILITSIFLMAACSRKAALKTGDITLSNMDDVSAVLAEHGLHNIDTFESWVELTDVGKEQFDTAGFDDADCRMTVMLLAGKDIKHDKVEKEYTGSYLMFDMDAIETGGEFSILKPEKQFFATLFGEMPITDGKFENAFPDNLKKYGIRFTGSDYSVISVIFKAYEDEEAFVGHTGILIPNGREYLFIEKIAFSDPFRVTEVKSEKDLISFLSKRSDYRVEEGEPSPLVYKDDALIGNLDK